MAFLIQGRIFGLVYLLFIMGLSGLLHQTGAGR